uniref:Uncharacterized protein n=1 Tax=Amphimedon queenslandica TaxID=400682 RepID=A0A1X7VGE4_AMPQE
MEREDLDFKDTRPSDRVGCVNPGMGSILSVFQHGWPMVPGREDKPHKLPGAFSSYTGTEILCETENQPIRPIKDRQHNSCCLHQQPRRDSIESTDFPNTKFVDVVSREEQSHPSTTPPRSIEQGSRHGIKDYEGQIRLKTASRVFLKIDEIYGPLEVDLFAPISAIAISAGGQIHLQRPQMLSARTGVG